MKLSTKLILSFTCVTFLLLAIGIASQYLNNEVKKRVVEESEAAVQEMELSGEMGIDLYKSLISTQSFLEDQYRRSININNGDPQFSVENTQNKVQLTINQFQKNLNISETLLKNFSNSQPGIAETKKDDVELLAELREKFNIYTSLVDQLISLTNNNYTDGREFYTTTIEPFFRTNLLPIVEQLRGQTQNNLDQEITQLDAKLDSISTILALATVGALILSLLLAYFLYRSIATPIQILSTAAQDIGSGNLDERIVINSNDEIGSLGNEFNKMAENLSMTTVSKDFMDNIIESIADALIVTDEDNNIQRINTAAKRMLGYQEEELIGNPVSDIFPDDDLVKLLKLGPEDSFKSYETEFHTLHNQTIPVSLSRALVNDRDGHFEGLVFVANDISQRKQAQQQISKSLKEKEILLAEIHHRVKNNLAVISGLLQMQIWETEDEAAEIALKDSQLRVQSIALVHEKLYQSESLSYIEFEKYIRDLLQAISSTYMDTENSIEIRTDLASVAININQAIPCSLLLNELIVNAYKHAFNNIGEGTIDVILRKENERVTLIIRDNGLGIPENFSISNSNSLGMSLINTLVKQLDGTIKTYNDRGAIFELVFNAEEVA